MTDQSVITTAPQTQLLRSASEPRGTFALIRAVGAGMPITFREQKLLAEACLAQRTMPGGKVLLTHKGLGLLATLQGAEIRSRELRARAQAETSRRFTRSLPYRDS